MLENTSLGVYTDTNIGIRNTHPALVNSGSYRNMYMYMFCVEIFVSALYPTHAFIVPLLHDLLI